MIAALLLQTLGTKTEIPDGEARYTMALNGYQAALASLQIGMANPHITPNELMALQDAFDDAAMYLNRLLPLREAFTTDWMGRTQWQKPHEETNGEDYEIRN